MSMFGYVINPVSRAVYQVPYNGDYEEIYQHIRADCFDCCRFSSKNSDGVFVDDEGLLGDMSSQSFFMIGEYPGLLAGYGFVLGVDEDGESCSPLTSIDDLNVRFFTYNQAIYGLAIERALAEK